MSVTPYMNLTLPTVGPNGTPGPTYAQEQNVAMTLIDSHNHTPGNGQTLGTSAMSVNSPFPFNSFDATLLRSTRFVSGSVLTLATDVNCLFVSGNNLYFNNASNTSNVQITSGNSVNGSQGSISGLPSGSAGVSYSSSTFTFNGATANLPATLVGGSLTLNVYNSGSAPVGGWTIAPPNGLASNLTLTLPGAYPGSTLPLLMGSTGTVTAGQITAAMVTNATLTTTQISATAGILGSQLSASAGIIGTQLAAGAAILGSQLSASAGIIGTQLSASANIAKSQLATENIVYGNNVATATPATTSFGAITDSLAPFSTLSVSLTSQGRPIVIVAQMGTNGSAISNFLAYSADGAVQNLQLVIKVNGATNIGFTQMNVLPAPSIGPAFTNYQYTWPPSALMFVWNSAVAGTPYTFTAQWAVSKNNVTANAGNMQLVAYEL